MQEVNANGMVGSEYKHGEKWSVLLTTQGDHIVKSNLKITWLTDWATSMENLCLYLTKST